MSYPLRLKRSSYHKRLKMCYYLPTLIKAAFTLSATTRASESPSLPSLPQQGPQSLPPFPLCHNKGLRVSLPSLSATTRASESPLPSLSATTRASESPSLPSRPQQGPQSLPPFPLWLSQEEYFANTEPSPKNLLENNDKDLEFPSLLQRCWHRGGAQCKNGEEGWVFWRVVV